LAEEAVMSERTNWGEEITTALQVPRGLLEVAGQDGPWIVSGNPSEKQMILMALALTSLTFPGWDHELSLLAARFGGFAMFQELKRYRRGAGSPDPAKGHDNF
jgi:hypothetical protein